MAKLILTSVDLLHRVRKMPDGMNFETPEKMFRRLIQEADRALADGDEARCIGLIERIYEFLDGELAACV
jgi:hypothetical protein